jgi:hypothetical protein
MPAVHLRTSAAAGDAVREITLVRGVKASLRRCGAVRGRCELVGGQRPALQAMGLWGQRIRPKSKSTLQNLELIIVCQFWRVDFCTSGYM